MPGQAAPTMAELVSETADPTPASVDAPADDPAQSSPAPLPTDTAEVQLENADAAAPVADSPADPEADRASVTAMPEAASTQATQAEDAVGVVASARDDEPSSAVPPVEEDEAIDNEEGAPGPGIELAQPSDAPTAAQPEPAYPPQAMETPNPAGPEPRIPPTPTSSTSANRSASASTASINQRARSSTVVSSSTTIPGSSHLSAVLVISSLETILSSKEAKRSQPLGEAAKMALDLLRGESVVEPGEEAEIVFEPLRLACETRSPQLMVTALDCIGKLVSYSFFSASHASPAASSSRRSSIIRPKARTPSVAADEITGSFGEAAQDDQVSPVDGLATATPSRERPPSPVASTRPEAALADAVTDTICNCFVDSACPESVQLQIVKALLALILAPASPGALQVHQSSLLRAVRAVYNIFLHSGNVTNQAVAQGALTQIVGHVFGRVERGEAAALALAARDEATRLADQAARPQKPFLAGAASASAKTSVPDALPEKADDAVAMTDEAAEAVAARPTDDDHGVEPNGVPVDDRQPATNGRAASEGAHTRNPSVQSNNLAPSEAPRERQVTL